MSVKASHDIPKGPRDLGASGRSDNDRPYSHSEALTQDRHNPDGPDLKSLGAEPIEMGAES